MHNMLIRFLSYGRVCVDFVHLMEWIGVSRNLCQQEKNDMTAMFILRRKKEDISAKSTPCHIQVKYIPFSSDEEANLYCKVFHKERNTIHPQIVHE